MYRKMIEAFGDQVRCICLVGGGGKTTIMMGLAEAYASCGRKVVVTTTTHMMHPEGEMAKRERAYPCSLPFVLHRPSDDAEESLRKIHQALDESGVVMTAAPDPKNSQKVMAPSAEYLERLVQEADILLVEADGSARRPLKIPRAWEPVVLPYTDVTIAVAGLRGLGHPIEDVCYCPEEMCIFLDKERSSPVELADLEKILTASEGLRRGSVGRFYVVLNQADTKEMRHEADRLLERLHGFGIEGCRIARRQRLAVILLAAGLSRRFGAQKMYAKLPDGRTMYMAAVERAERIPAECHILVAKDESMREAMKARASEGETPHTWDVVINEHPEYGIAGSMQCGLSAAPDVDGMMFMVCDQPGLSDELPMRMIEEWKAFRGDIISASYQGVPGNPKLFSMSFREELMALCGDVGGRQIIQRHRDCLILVEARSAEELKDIDHAEDLVQLPGRQS